MPRTGIKAAVAAATATTVMLASASSAAAFGLTGLVSQPQNTDAGAHSAFTTELTISHAGVLVTPAEQLRDLRVSLPPGLAGNPQSVPKCAVEQLNADACPAGSQIGSTTNVISVLGLPVPVSVPGGVYNVQPQSGEPARLGIVLRPAVGDRIITQVQVELREDYGLDTILTDLPPTANIEGILDAPIRIDSVELTLSGDFMSNPTSCGEQTTTFSARSYGMAEGDPPVTGTASYTATNCERQPYDPNASLKIDSQGGPMEVGAPLDVTTVVTQSAGQANDERVAVLLPKALAVNGNVLENSCPPESFEAGTCPPASKVGSATAVSPLLDAPLEGPVYVVTGDAVFPKIGLDLKGSLPLKITGQSSVTAEGALNVFEGLPDLPLFEFKLHFPAAGADSLIKVASDPCAPGVAMNVDFTSHAGQNLKKSIPPELIGCGGQAGKPKARVRIKGARKGKPRTTIQVSSPDAGISAVTVKLPKAMKLAKKAKRRIAGKADGVKLKAKSFAPKGRTLKVRGFGAADGVKRISLTIKPAALAKPAKVKRGKRLAFRISVTRPGEALARSSVKARAR